MTQYQDLTDAQWEIVRPLIPEPERREDGRGRPWKGRREVLDGILYVLRTGSAWAELPDRYPPYQTCHRRFRQWVQSDVMKQALEALDQASRSDARPGEPALDQLLRLNRGFSMPHVDPLNLPSSPALRPTGSVLLMLEKRIRR